MNWDSSSGLLDPDPRTSAALKFPQTWHSRILLVPDSRQVKSVQVGIDRPGSRLPPKEASGKSLAYVYLNFLIHQMGLQ